MFTNRIASYYSQDKVLIEAACLSTDTKPTTGVANGSKCIEMDTGKKYMFNEEDSEWEELPSSGGGGGGGSSDSITVTMSFTSDPDGLSVVLAKTTGLELATVLPTPQEFELVGSGSALILPYGMYNNVTGAEPYGQEEFLKVLDGATVVFS